MINLNNYKVIHGEKVLRALQILQVDFLGKEINEKDTVLRPSFLEVAALDENNNFIILRDETWRFQFLPIVKKGE